MLIDVCGAGGDGAEPYAWHGGDANRRSDPDGGCCRCGKGRATVGSMQGATVSPASMQLLYCDVM